jgi:hypothetical protein
VLVRLVFLKEIEYAILLNPEVREKGYGVGFLHLEELDSDLALGLMSIHANKRFGLPDTEASEDELKRLSVKLSTLTVSLSTTTLAPTKSTPLWLRFATWQPLDVSISFSTI